MEMEMEMEMRQQQQQIVLVNMGFSEELAAEALTVTGGDILKATDWILCQSQSSANPNPINDCATSTSNSTSTPTIFTQPPPSPSASTVGNSDTGLPPPPASLSKNMTEPSSEKIPQPPSQPLSERMRPQTLHQVVGQDHILGPNSALRSAIRCCRLPSLLLWGPPGTGKTSIARAIVLDANNSSSFSSSDAAAAAGYRFVQLSAVNSGVKDVRDAVEEARNWEKSSSKTKTKKRRLMRTVLFIDEVHRFNKAQQDSLLPVIEDGRVVFIGLQLRTHFSI